MANEIEVGYYDPSSAPEMYNFALIAGIPTPGIIAEVSNGGRPFKWDTKEADGKSGGSPTGKGAQLTKPRIRLLLWNEHQGANHFQGWYEELKPRLDQAAYASPPEALPIDYPTLADNGITLVSVAEIGALEPEGRGGLWSVTIDFIEVQEPKAAGGTPDKVAGGGGSGGSGSGNWTTEDYTDAYNAEVEALQQAMEDQADYEAWLQAQEQADKQQNDFQSDYSDGDDWPNDGPPEGEWYEVT